MRETSAPGGHGGRPSGPERPGSLEVLLAARPRLPPEQYALELLRLLAEELDRQTDPARVVERALALLVPALDLETGWAGLLEADGRFTLAACSGLPPALEARDRAALRWFPCLCQRMLLEGALSERAAILTCERLERARRETRQEAIRGRRRHLSLPLCVGGAQLGVISLVWPAEEPPAEATTVLLSLAGWLVSQAVYRCRRQGLMPAPQTSEGAAALWWATGDAATCEALLRQVLHALWQMFDFDLGVALAAGDQEAGQLDPTLVCYLPRPVNPSARAFAYQSVMAAWTRARGHPPEVVAVAEHRGPRYHVGPAVGASRMTSALTVSVEAGGEVVGLLHIAAERPNAFGEGETQSLHAVAAQTALALRRLRAAQARERARLRALVAAMEEGFLLLDARGRILVDNPAALAILERLGAALPDSPWEPLQALGPLSPQTLRESLGGERRTVTHLVSGDQGAGPVVRVRALRVETAAGQGVLVLLQDVTEARLREQQVRQLTTRDPLTGVSNRHRFFETLEIEVLRARRYGAPLSLLVLEMENFGAVNERHGHLVGDALLVKVADLLRRRSRGTDLVARLGGDEFALLLPHTPLVGAATLARRLRQAVGRIHVEEGVGVAATLGAAALEAGDGPTGRELLARAERAVRLARERGCGVCLLPARGEPVSWDPEG